MNYGRLCASPFWYLIPEVLSTPRCSLHQEVTAPSQKKKKNPTHKQIVIFMLKFLAGLNKQDAISELYRCW